jgi:hypothetical protein
MLTCATFTDFPTDSLQSLQPVSMLSLKMHVTILFTGYNQIYKKGDVVPPAMHMFARRHARNSVSPLGLFLAETYNSHDLKAPKVSSSPSFTGAGHLCQHTRHIGV